MMNDHAPTTVDFLLLVDAKCAAARYGLSDRHPRSRSVLIAPGRARRKRAGSDWVSLLVGLDAHRSCAFLFIVKAPATTARMTSRQRREIATAIEQIDAKRRERVPA